MIHLAEPEHLGKYSCFPTAERPLKKGKHEKVIESQQNKKRECKERSPTHGRF